MNEPHHAAMRLLRDFRRPVARIATGNAAAWEVLDLVEDAIWDIETCTPEDERIGVFRSFWSGVLDLMAVGMLVKGARSGSAWRDAHMEAVIRIAREMK
jgi:hypothetical protein